MIRTSLTWASGGSDIPDSAAGMDQAAVAVSVNELSLIDLTLTQGVPPAPGSRPSQCGEFADITR
jgi:hypothetical protein